MLTYGFSPKKILRLATVAFRGEYSESDIRATLKVFIKRFFAQQFKRSCLPDGPRVCEVSLSPRGAFMMPSDSVCEAWLCELE
jgi:NAD+ synthase (glutamine-hydrolysing)